jgi:signal transduction histidine kinase
LKLSLVALLMAVPLVVLLWGLTAVGVSAWSVAVMLGIWCAAEVPLLLRLERQRRRAGEDDVTDELFTLGARAARAEATLRRDEDRFHELRSTVAAIGTTYRLLRDRRDRIPGGARDALESLCETELARLERMLLDSSPGATQILDVGAVVDPLVESLRFRGCQVVREGATARAVGRPDDIAEIVNTLLENALRHAPDSPVTVRVSAEPSHVELSVTDQGPGVRPEVARRLFERGARSSDSPGQGIGLHVAHRLAREMGAELRLERDDSVRGATFTLSLRSAEGVAE